MIAFDEQSHKKNQKGLFKFQSCMKKNENKFSE